MDSYSFHLERMNNLDLHPLSLPISRLSPSKSSSSIDHFPHHLHGKGDSAYSSFSGGSNAPDFPSPFLPDDLQSGGFHHYADLKYVRAIYNPGEGLQSDSRSMDQLYRSVEAISKQYRHSDNRDNRDSAGNGVHSAEHCDREDRFPAPPPMPPPPPARLDSYIATRNLENSRAHHSAEGQQAPQPPRQPQRGQTANSEAVGLRSDPVYGWRGTEPYHREPLNPDSMDNSPEQHKSANNLSRSPPRGTSQSERQKQERQAIGAAAKGGHFEGDLARAQTAHRPASSWHVARNLINSSIQHKGQFYFVTGVCKPPESDRGNVSPCLSEARSGGPTVVEIRRLVEREREKEKEREREREEKEWEGEKVWEREKEKEREKVRDREKEREKVWEREREREKEKEREREKEREKVWEREKDKERDSSHSSMDNLFRNPYPRYHNSQDITNDERDYIAKTQNPEDQNHGSDSQVSRSCAASEPSLISQVRERSRHHSSNYPFYCGPEDHSPVSSSLPNEITPPPVVEQANPHAREDPGVRKGRSQPLGDVATDRISKETTPLLYHLTGASRAALKPKPETPASLGCQDRPVPDEGCTEERVEVSAHPCHTLDDSFKKYYKEQLKDALPKVLRETSFKRRDLQLSWPHRVRASPYLRPNVLYSITSSQDPDGSTHALTSSLAISEGTERVALKEDVRESEKESVKESKKEGGRPANVAQPQVARIGGRKRLTQEQKKLCFSEPENLNQLGEGTFPAGRSLDSEREELLSGQEEHGEQGLVAARRKMFETRGRALSASSISKTTLKHLQHTALVAYMERKTGQKVAEPQQPPPLVPPAPSQRHSAVGKPLEWGPKPQDSGGKCPKKPLHRPLSAGRILDSSSSSIRYAQFSSAQSSADLSGGQSHQSSWRDKPGPSHGKSASAESLLDQPEPPEFFRNRSISIPHTTQGQSYANSPSQGKAVKTSSLQSTTPVEALRPSQVGPPDSQRMRVTAPRGKSMEELGASTAPARPSVLSRSTEQLDLLRGRQGGPGRDRTSPREGRDQTTQGQEGEAPRGSDSAQRKHLLKQHSAPQIGNEDDGPTGGARDSARPSSPSSSVSSWVGSRLARPWSSGPMVVDLTTAKPPSEDANQEPSEKEIKSSSPFSVLHHHHHQKMPSESNTCASLTESSPGASEEREESVDDPSEAPPPEANQEVSLSCGVTTDPSLWVVLPEPGSSTTEDDQAPPPPDIVAEGQSPPPAPAQHGNEPFTPSATPTPEPDTCLGVEREGGGEVECSGEEEEEKGEAQGESPPGEKEEPEKSPPSEEPQWEELVEEVVAADQSLAPVLYPLTNRKTALMLMEQLLSEDSLLMEEHYKKKQGHKEQDDSSGTVDGVQPSPCSSSSSSSSSSTPDSEDPRPPNALNKAEVAEKKRQLMARIGERVRGLEESRRALQLEAEENRLLGRAVEALVRERCRPTELERYTLFIGDLERVVSLLLCLSARLARVQNALSTVDRHTDAEDKQSLDNRYRLLCKQREDATDLKDNLDRRERLVSTFLSLQLSVEQLQDYRRFVQTKASLLIRQKDLEERQRLGDEQLEALANSLPP